MNSVFFDDINIIATAPINWFKLENKTILIAGANGYVPQYFVHGFLKRNDLYDANIKVVALCRNFENASKRFKTYFGRSDFELIVQDVVFPIEYIDEIDYIIDAACPANLKSRYDNIISAFETAVFGCKNLLDLARQKGAVLEYISSVDIYGLKESGERLTEMSYGVLDPLNVRNVYACSKKAAENLCCCYANSGVNCKIVRPSQIMGGGIALDDGRLHIDFISQMLENNRIVLKGDGTPKRSFIYITDAIIAMLFVLLDGNSGEAYNVCTETGEATVLELAQKMQSLVTSRNVLIEYNMETRKTDVSVTQVVPSVFADSQKLQNLGWRPKIDLEESCRRMMKYYELYE